MLLGHNSYTSALDMWSTGLILMELWSRRPLFPGDSEIDQLFKIFRLCGTPNDMRWPGVTKLPDYGLDFPNWSPQPIAGQVPGLDPAGVDLLQRIVILDPEKRFPAAHAVHHRFFASVRSMKELPSIAVCQEVVEKAKQQGKTMAAVTAGKKRQRQGLVDELRGASDEEYTTLE